MTFLCLAGAARSMGIAITNGPLNIAGGLVALGFDLAYRRTYLAGSLLDESGGRLFYFPLWLWGIVWIISGAIQTVGLMLQ